jgi:hypothetical protein
VADPAGHGALAPGVELTGNRSRDLGDKVPALRNPGFVARNMLGHKTDHRSSGSTAKAEVAIRTGIGVYGGDPDTGED